MNYERIMIVLLQNTIRFDSDKIAIFKSKIKFLVDVNEAIMNASDDSIDSIDSAWIDNLKAIAKDATKDVLDYLSSCV